MAELGKRTGVHLKSLQDAEDHEEEKHVTRTEGMKQMNLFEHRAETQKDGKGEQERKIKQLNYNPRTYITKKQIVGENEQYKGRQSQTEDEESVSDLQFQLGLSQTQDFDDIPLLS